MRRPLVSVAALTVLAVGSTVMGACRAGTVEVVFSPEAGATYRYRAEVDSLTVTELPGRAPVEVRDRATLEVSQQVLEVGPTGVRVQVVLSGAGTGDRTFVMRFDRAAQLTEVESIEGIPTGALGELGLSEIFPAAAGAPPARPLSPGDRWTIDDEVALPGMTIPGRLTGSGRLSELGVVDGQDTATIIADVTLGVSTTALSRTGGRALDGPQRTTSEITYDLTDGAVRSASASTEGEFRLVLTPPSEVTSTAVTGTLRLEIRSSIQRLD